MSATNTHNPEEEIATGNSYSDMNTTLEVDYYAIDDLSYMTSTQYNNFTTTAVTTTSSVTLPEFPLQPVAAVKCPVVKIVRYENEGIKEGNININSNLVQENAHHILPSDTLCVGGKYVQPEHHSIPDLLPTTDDVSSYHADLTAILQHHKEMQEIDPSVDITDAIAQVGVLPTVPNITGQEWIRSFSTLLDISPDVDKNIISLYRQFINPSTTSSTPTNENTHSVHDASVANDEELPTEESTIGHSSFNYLVLPITRPDIPQYSILTQDIANYTLQQAVEKAFKLYYPNMTPSAAEMNLQQQNEHNAKQFKHQTNSHFTLPHPVLQQLSTSKTPPSSSITTASMLKLSPVLLHAFLLTSNLTPFLTPYHLNNKLHHPVKQLILNEVAWGEYFTIERIVLPLLPLSATAEQLECILNNVQGIFNVPQYSTFTTSNTDLVLLLEAFKQFVSQCKLQNTNYYKKDDSTTKYIFPPHLFSIIYLPYVFLIQELLINHPKLSFTQLVPFSLPQPYYQPHDAISLYNSLILSTTPSGGCSADNSFSSPPTTTLSEGYASRRQALTGIEEPMALDCDFFVNTHHPRFSATLLLSPYDYIGINNNNNSNPFGCDSGNIIDTTKAQCEEHIEMSCNNIGNNLVHDDDECETIHPQLSFKPGDYTSGCPLVSNPIPSSYENKNKCKCTNKSEEKEQNEITHQQSNNPSNQGQKNNNGIETHTSWYTRIFTPHSNGLGIYTSTSNSSGDVHNNASHNNKNTKQTKQLYNTLLYQWIGLNVAQIALTPQCFYWNVYGMPILSQYLRVILEIFTCQLGTAVYFIDDVYIPLGFEAPQQYLSERLLFNESSAENTTYNVEEKRKKLFFYKTIGMIPLLKPKNDELANRQQHESTDNIDIHVYKYKMPKYVHFSNINYSTNKSQTPSHHSLLISPNQINTIIWSRTLFYNPTMQRITYSTQQTEDENNTTNNTNNTTNNIQTFVIKSNPHRVADPYFVQSISASIRHVVHNPTLQLTDESHFSAPFRDVLQIALQPLGHQLENATYEVFERDPVKYRQYKLATEQYLLHLKRQFEKNWYNLLSLINYNNNNNTNKNNSQPPSPSNSQQNTTTTNDTKQYQRQPPPCRPAPPPQPPQPPVFNVCILGAGRGPLILEAIKASQNVNIPCRFYAVEKNPFAYVSLIEKVYAAGGSGKGYCFANQVVVDKNTDNVGNDDNEEIEYLENCTCNEWEKNNLTHVHIVLSDMRDVINNPSSIYNIIDINNNNGNTQGMMTNQNVEVEDAKLQKTQYRATLEYLFDTKGSHQNNKNNHDINNIKKSITTIENIPRYFHIIISELLGSFGDNELSPECLWGIENILTSPLLLNTTSSQIPQRNTMICSEGSTDNRNDILRNVINELCCAQDDNNNVVCLDNNTKINNANKDTLFSFLYRLSLHNLQGYSLPHVSRSYLAPVTATTVYNNIMMHNITSAAKLSTAQHVEKDNTSIATTPLTSIDKNHNNTTLEWFNYIKNKSINDAKLNKLLHTPYVTLLHDYNIISKPQECFTFYHPDPMSSLKSDDINNIITNTNNDANTTFDNNSTNANNNSIATYNNTNMSHPLCRYQSLTFKLNSNNNNHNNNNNTTSTTNPHLQLVHGFAGYFDAILYDPLHIQHYEQNKQHQLNDPNTMLRADNDSTDVGSTIGYSILPETYSHGMFSWFPFFIPLNPPILIRTDPCGDDNSKNNTINVEIWRKCDGLKVWYELKVENHDIIFNPDGVAYSIGLRNDGDLL